MAANPESWSKIVVSHRWVHSKGLGKAILTIDSSEGDFVKEDFTLENYQHHKFIKLAISP